MHSQHARARSRSLSYGSSRSVRARPATVPAPTKYNDGTTMDAEEHEARRWLRIHDSDYTGSSTATSPWAPSITYLEKTA